METGKLPINLQLRAALGIIDYHPTGSRYVCDPPVTDTDIDYLIRCEDMEACCAGLEALGWDCEPDGQYERDDYEIAFATARKGEINLIIYDSFLGFAAFRSATETAKKLNLKEKEDRVALFAAVCSGRRADLYA